MASSFAPKNGKKNLNVNFLMTSKRTRFIVYVVWIVQAGLKELKIVKTLQKRNVYIWF